MNGSNRGRRNWTFSMTIAVLTAAAAAAIGSKGAGPSPQTDRIYLRSSAGPVLFDHGKHQVAAGSCASCHHDLLGSGLEGSCEDCHDDSFQAGDFEHAELKQIHAQDCSGCHAQVREEGTAESCRACHPDVQESEQRITACTECHDDGYSPDMMEHDAFLETGDHSCLGCHNPGSIAEAYHTNCTACHLQASSGRFADAQGNAHCGACHLH